MAQNDQSSLRFSLEETIWFRKGQEVEELVSISLDPEIAVEEQEHFVVIRGQLRLSGEYLSVEEAIEEEETLTSGKYVQEVRVDDEGGMEFYHGFPIDISIPKNRVHSLEDIEVSIETFDYEIPEKSCLKLTVDLTIDGTAARQIGDEMYPLDEEIEEVEVFPRERHKEILEEETNEQERIYPLYSEQDTELEEEEGTFYAEAKRTEKTEFSLEETEEVSIGERVSEEDKWKGSGNETKKAATKKEQATRNEAEQERTLFDSEEAVEADKIFIEDAVEHEGVTAHQSEAKGSGSTEENKFEEQEEEKPKQKLFKKKKQYESISLKEFFARKDDEKPAKLKVCIVQNGETLDQIAERYEVSVQQIIKENQLETTQSVSGGQVLYIPEPKTAKH
ncbi:MAG: stage VI sporulation protein D [Bacillales bacterium]|nr:stage VI sporulation protein D [Bacillales bacterium]